MVKFLQLDPREKAKTAPEMPSKRPRTPPTFPPKRSRASSSPGPSEKSAAADTIASAIVFALCRDTDRVVGQGGSAELLIHYYYTSGTTTHLKLQNTPLALAGLVHTALLHVLSAVAITITASTVEVLLLLVTIVVVAMVVDT